MADIVVIDVETTGLDPERHEIIEIAAIRCDSELHETRRFHSLVKPRHPQTASPEALRINGYDEVVWAAAPDFRDVAADLYSVLSGAIPAGHNVEFDLEFVRRAITHHYDMPPLDYHRLDTAPLIWAACGRYSLAAGCEVFEVHNEAPHRALGDALATLGVLRRARAAMRDAFGV